MKTVRRLALLVLALAFLGMLLPPAASAAPSSSADLPLLGHVGGVANDIAAGGRYAYLAIGLRIQVIDLLDPTHPVLVAQTPIFPDEVRNLALQDGVLYAAVTPGVYIFDVSQPAAIHQIGFWPQSNPGEPVFNVKVRGPYAYVAGGQGLRILDVTDPTAPAPIALLHGAVGFYLAVAPGEGEPVYVGGNTDLYVVSVTDPRQPVLAGQFLLSSSSYITAIAALHDYIYVGYSYLGSSKGSVVVLDAISPSAPQQVGSVSPGGYVRGLTAASGLLYASVIGRGLVQLDLTDLAAPLVAAEAAVPSNAISAALMPGAAHIAVADGRQGLVVFGSTGKGNLTRTAALDLPGACDDLAVTGDVAVCANRQNDGLRVFDLANPAALRQTQLLRSLSDPIQVAASGKRVYVADADDMRLHTFEIAPDRTLTKLGWTNQLAYLIEMAARGDLVYTLDGRQFAVLDATNSAPARYMGWYRINNQAGFVVADTRAYVWDGAGVTLLDISDAAHITAVGHIEARVDKIAATRNHLFLAADNILYDYDVTGPAAPRRISETSLLDRPSDMAVSGSYLYVSYQFHGTRVFRLAPGQPPELAAAAKWAGMPEQLEVQGGKLVVAGSAGLVVYQGMQERVFLPLVLR